MESLAAAEEPSPCEFDLLPRLCFFFEIDVTPRLFGVRGKNLYLGISTLRALSIYRIFREKKIKPNFFSANKLLIFIRNRLTFVPKKSKC